MTNVMTAAPKTKIIYIAGYGRSGTTLMSMALGQHPSIFGAGEITELSRHAWVDNTYCSCGRALKDCPNWSEVAGRWLSLEGSTVMESYRQYQLRFERLPVMPALGFDAGKTEDFLKFEQQTVSLFRLISLVSNKETVVDSSKSPGRAWALTRMPGLEVYVVHMVRDGRGVAWSLMKGYKRDVKAGIQRELVPKPALRTAIRWTMINLAAEFLKRTVGPDRYIRIRYEDLVDNPAATMSRIGDMIGADLHSVGEDLKLGRPITPQHQVAGSRMRMNTTIKLQNDDAWHAQMPKSSQWIFTGACGWLLRRYGYS